MILNVHNDTINDLCEDAIHIYSQWLNCWHRVDDPTFILKRSTYDEYDDPPIVRFVSHTWDRPCIIALAVNPFHDEGGPHTLFILTNGARGDLIDCIIQDFDTTCTVIYQDGQLQHMPEEA